MMEQLKHAPGDFCWEELGTSSAAAAKSFYSTLFGWQTQDEPAAHGSYTMISLQGKVLGALYEITEDMKAQGAVPAWLSYVTVNDVKASGKKAESLGGKVLMSCEVPEAGTMALIQDTTGALLGLWQPKNHCGTMFTDGTPSTVSWRELLSTNVDQSVSFYTQLFSWKAMVQEVAGMPYTLLMNGEKMAAGILQMPKQAPGPSHWLAYFSVANCDETHKKAVSLKANVCVPPTDIPTVGRFSVLMDPTGATFALIQHVSS